MRVHGMYLQSHSGIAWIRLSHFTDAQRWRQQGTVAGVYQPLHNKSWGHSYVEQPSRTRLFLPEHTHFDETLPITQIARVQGYVRF